jgi:hypothetical protein
MAFPFLLVAVFLFGLVGALLLQPKPKIENAKADSFDNLNFPRSSEGAPVPWMIGKVRMRGPNSLWAGDFEARPIKKKVKTGLFSSKKQIVGYQYFVGLVLGLALGPGVTLRRIWSAKDELWAGTASADGTAIAINKPNLYGGKEKGGGFVGTIRFYSGSFTQAVNAYYQSKQGSGNVTAYRGTALAVLEHCDFGEQNSLRELNFELEKYTNGLGLAGGKQVIGEDSNPMEALYQVFTDDWGGLNVSPGMLDLDSFTENAYTLYDEVNGFSMIVSAPNHGKDVAAEILRQVDGLLYVDPETAKIRVRLVRNDFVIADLLTFNEANVMKVSNFTRKLWEDTINQVRTTYTNREKKYETGTGFDQDFSNIQAQGRVKSITISYPGCTTGVLANQLATRDLSQGSIPIMSATIETNRDGAALRPGDRFIWTWGAYNLTEVIMRVKSFDLGALNDNKIAIVCIQDEFALDLTTFATPESGGTSPAAPDDPAVAAPSRFLMEASGFFAAAGGINATDQQSVILVSAEAPTGGETYDVYTSKNAGVDYQLSEENIVFTAFGQLETAITATSSLATGKIATLDLTIDVTDVDAFTATEVGQGFGMFVIGKELFAHEGVTDNLDGTVTLANVWRALLDTAPTAHSVGDDVYLIEGDAVIDDTFPYTSTLRVKTITKTFSDELDLTAAPYDSITLNKRTARPLKQANVKFDGGAAFAPPALGTGAHTVTWANRNRKSAVLRTIVDNTNEYETGQQSIFRYRINAGAWVSATIAPGITTYAFNAGAGGGDTVDYELFATRDGLDSFDRWTFTAGAAAGGGSSEDTGGDPPVDGTPGYSLPTGVSIVFPFGETIGTYPIDIPITFAMTIPAGLTGTNVDHDVNPTAIATFTLKHNGVAVGTVAISIAGAYTLTAAAAIVLAAGDSLSCVPPAIADSTLTGVSITVAATRNG